MRYLKHPITGKPDLMVTLTCLAVFAATFKFLLDGVAFTVLGHTVDFGHVDPLAYGSLLTPVLGAHGYIGVRGYRKQSVPLPRPEDPDANNV